MIPTKLLKFLTIWLNETYFAWETVMKIVIKLQSKDFKMWPTIGTVTQNLEFHSEIKTFFYMYFWTIEIFHLGILRKDSKTDWSQDCTDQKKCTDFFHQTSKMAIKSQKLGIIFENKVAKKYFLIEKKSETFGCFLALKKLVHFLWSVQFWLHSKMFWNLLWYKWKNHNYDWNIRM